MPSKRPSKTSVAEDTLSVDPSHIPELWEEIFRIYGHEYNIVSCLNLCQAYFDNTTLWTREDDNYMSIKYENEAKCETARQGTHQNITADNKVCETMDEFQIEKHVAFQALVDFNTAEYSKETIKGTMRQKAAKKGAANRKANKARQKEEDVCRMAKELCVLRDCEGPKDAQYKMRFDKVLANLVAATGVKLPHGLI